ADRQVTLSVLARDRTFTGPLADRGDLRQRYLRAAAGIYEQISQCCGGVACRIQVTDSQWVGSLADINSRYGRLADARLDDVLDVGHVDPVARRLVVIELDFDLGNGRLLEHRCARGAGNAVE